MNQVNILLVRFGTGGIKENRFPNAFHKRSPVIYTEQRRFGIQFLLLIIVS